MRSVKTFSRCKRLHKGSSETAYTRACKRLHGGAEKGSGIDLRRDQEIRRDYWARPVLVLGVMRVSAKGGSPSLVSALARKKAPIG